MSDPQFYNNPEINTKVLVNWRHHNELETPGTLKRDIVTLLLGTRYTEDPNPLPIYPITYVFAKHSLFVLRLLVLSDVYKILSN